MSSAHAIEREYRVMKAVSDHGVPVPRMLCLCQDERLVLIVDIDGKFTTFSSSSSSSSTRAEQFKQPVYRFSCVML